MKLDTLLEVLHAATLTNRVDSKFPSRGGLFLVSPPGQLKTSLLSCFEDQLGVLCYSDLTTTTLIQARDLFASRKASTLILYDMQKLYERRQDTAANIEGNLRSLMDEGFTDASFENVSKNVIQTRARALVLAACTPNFYRRKLADWEQSGFARRVIFCVYSLKNPELIQNAILTESPLSIGTNNGPGTWRFPYNLRIPCEINGKDEQVLRRALHKQNEDVPLILMRNILCVLRWRYKSLGVADRCHEVIEEFSEALHRGAEVEIEETGSITRASINGKARDAVHAARIQGGGGKGNGKSRKHRTS